MPHFPSLPLRFERASTPLAYQSTDGTEESVCPARLITELHVYVKGESLVKVECLVDTGAPLCVFPKGTWLQHWFRELEPVNRPARNSTGVQGLTRESRVKAGLGLIDISVLGITPPTSVIESPVFTIVAKFLKEPSPDYKRVLLGINAIEHWRALEVDFKYETARLLGTA